MRSIDESNNIRACAARSMSNGHSNTARAEITSLRHQRYAASKTTRPRTSSASAASQETTQYAATAPVRRIVTISATAEALPTVRWHTLHEMSGSTDRSVARDRTTRNSPRRLRRAAATGPGTFCCATFCCDVAAFPLHRPLHHSCARQHLFAEQHRVEP